MKNRASSSNHACDKQPCQDVPAILIQDVLAILIQDVHAKLGVHPTAKTKISAKNEPGVVNYNFHTG